jgi:hypothetical protein
MLLHEMEENVRDGSACGKRFAPMQKFMTFEGDRASPRRATIQSLCLNEDAERPVGIRGERRRNRNFARGTIAMGSHAITRPVQAEIAVSGD